MATVGRVTALWQNFIGSPGYSRFSFENPQNVADAGLITAKVRTFFSSLAGLLPNGATVQVLATVECYDEQTGILVTELTATAVPAIVTGTAPGTTTWAGGAGAFIGWKTTSIWQGRRVQGRTFLVPLSGASDTNGTLTTGAVTTITTAGNNLISPSTPAFGVWAKKYSVDQNGKRIQVDGSFFLSTSVSVPDKTGVLRSRRD